MKLSSVAAGAGRQCAPAGLRSGASWRPLNFTVRCHAAPPLTALCIGFCAGFPCTSFVGSTLRLLYAMLGRGTGASRPFAPKRTLSGAPAVAATTWRMGSRSHSLSWLPCIFWPHFR